MHTEQFISNLALNFFPQTQVQIFNKLGVGL